MTSIPNHLKKIPWLLDIPSNTLRLPLLSTWNPCSSFQNICSQSTSILRCTLWFHQSMTGYHLMWKEANYQSWIMEEAFSFTLSSRLGFMREIKLVGSYLATSISFCTIFGQTVQYFLQFLIFYIVHDLCRTNDFVLSPISASNYSFTIENSKIVPRQMWFGIWLQVLPLGAVSNSS